MRQPSRLASTFLPACSKSCAFFQKPVGDEKFRIALLGGEPAPDFRHDQTHVVIHAQLRPDVAGGGDERVVAGEDERHERVVQVNDRRQRVERAFGQRAFGTRAGGGRRFAGHAANHFHEQFRQLHEMNRVVARERADAFFRRIVAAARQHGGDGRVQRLARRHAAAQARGNFREIRFAGADEVGTLLQIARIFRRLAVHEARIGGADEIIRRAGLRDFAHEFLHRLGELVEAQRVLDHVARVRRRERLVVGKEIFRLDEIIFRLLVVAAMNRVVGPLEQALFAVLRRISATDFCPCLPADFPARRRARRWTP